MRQHGKKTLLLMALALFAGGLQLIVAPSAHANNLHELLNVCKSNMGNDFTVSRNNGPKSKCWEVRRASSHTWAVDKSTEFGCGGKNDKDKVDMITFTGVASKLTMEGLLITRPTGANSGAVVRAFPYTSKIVARSGDVFQKNSYECGFIRDVLFKTFCEKNQEQTKASYDCIKPFQSYDLLQTMNSAWNAAQSQFAATYRNFVANPYVNPPSADAPPVGSTSSQSLTSPTSSSGDCKAESKSVKDTSGKTFSKVYWCTNRGMGQYTNTPMWSDVGKSRNGAPTNYMKPGRNWIACVKEFETDNPTTKNSNGSTNTNSFWGWTWGDGPQGNDVKWGWIPLTFITQGSNDSPAGIASC